MSRGYKFYLMYVWDTHVESLMLDYVPIAWMFLDVFPDDLSSIPPDREIEFSIDLEPGIQPISYALCSKDGWY